MIKTFIQNFIEEKRLTQGVSHVILDQKGKKICEGTSDNNLPAFNVYADLAMRNLKNLHMVRNMGLRGDTGHIIQHTMKQYGSWKDVYACFGEWDINYMLYKNWNDEYIFDGYTLVSPNGTILTMLRSKDFNEEKFRIVYSEYVNKLRNYDGQGDLENYSYTFSDYLHFKEAGVMLLQDRGETIFWEEG